MRHVRKAVVEKRYPLAGYVYNGSHDARVGFSPMSTVTRTPPVEGEAIAVWETNWGAPDKIDFPYMMAALRAEFPEREVVPA